MTVNNAANNKPGSIEEIPLLSYELQKRPELVIVQNTDVIVTGNTLETTLYEAAIPVDKFSNNSIIEIYGLFSFTNSANNKSIKMYLGSTLIASTTGFTGNTSAVFSRTIFNRNSRNSQVMANINQSAVFGSSPNAVTTLSIDTTQNLVFKITGQLVLSTENITLRASYLRINYQA